MRFWVVHDGLTGLPISDSFLLMILRAALFDFGDTLLSNRLDWDGIMPAALANLEHTLRPDYPALDFERLKRDFLSARQAGRIRAQQELVEAPAVESLGLAFSLQGETLVPAAILQKGVDAYFAAEELAYPVIAGIPETLCALKAMHLRLAVISNATCGKLIRRALERRNLLSAFDAVAVSAEFGRCKPDPAFFRYALDLLKIPSQQAVVIGDMLSTDIEGAARTCMPSILVNFHGDRLAIPAAGPQPNAIIHEPKELISLFLEWTRGKQVALGSSASNNAQDDRDPQ